MGAYAIERLKAEAIEPVGDWYWEQADKNLLPNSKSREQPDLELLPNLESREQPNLKLLPNSLPITLVPESRELLPNLESREQPKLELLPNSKSREQLPNSEIREQLETGQTVIGYSIVNVKGQRYLLTHSKSKPNKTLPTGKGWQEIKPKGENQYLYLRWRVEKKQKSACMGRVDRLN